jgi:predicted SAM-dependent methyltransferase
MNDPKQTENAVNNTPATGQPKRVALNLGCGTLHLPGFINVDCVASVNPDQVANLDEFPWPWANDSVDHIWADHCLEHLEDTVKVMEEVHRILKPGGTFEAKVPWGNCYYYFQDPTHRHSWMDHTIEYFTSDHMPHYTNARFELVFNKLISDGRKYNIARWKVLLRSLIPFRSVLKYFIIGVYDEIHFCVRKPLANARPR